METIGRIICYDLDEAPADSWHCKKHVGINRLYYIHSGCGGYSHDGKTYPLIPGNIYFIPYTADFIPFCEAENPILHTYIDFELIPPIITSEVATIEGAKNEKSASAVSVFNLGGKLSRHRDVSPLYNDPFFWELCQASIIYLVNLAVSENGIEKISDRIVIKALQIMHTKMSENLTVNDIARECYMSPDGFIRHFCKAVGMTPRAYLKKIRLQTARCLKESGMNLAKIANDVGYADASSLAHALQNESKKVKDI